MESILAMLDVQLTASANPETSNTGYISLLGRPVLNAARRAIAGGKPLYVKRAVLSDLDTILGLISEAKEWLRFRGTDQWSTDWPDHDGRRRNDRVVHSIKEGKTWLVWQPAETSGAIPVGTVTIEEQANPHVWTDPEVTDEPAVYLSRLVTARAFGGLQIGSAVIEWAGKRGARSHGARHIRIDVWTTNHALHRYYQRRGFRACGSCPDETYPSRALFGRPALMQGWGPPVIGIDE